MEDRSLRFARISLQIGGFFCFVGSLSGLVFSGFNGMFSPVEWLTLPLMMIISLGIVIGLLVVDNSKTHVLGLVFTGYATFYLLVNAGYQLFLQEDYGGAMVFLSWTPVLYLFSHTVVRHKEARVLCWASAVTLYLFVGLLILNEIAVPPGTPLSDAFYTLILIQPAMILFIFGAGEYREYNAAEQARSHQLVHDSAIIAEKEREYRSIFDNMVDTYYRSDKDGCLVTVSPSVVDIGGFDAEELIGKQLSEYYVDKNKRAEFLARIEEGGGRVIEFEAEIGRKGGGTLWTSTSARYWKDADGTILGDEGTIRNITEQKMAAEALNRSRKMDAVGQLTGGIAHDYNNMLGVIIGNIQMVEGAADLDDKSRQRLGKALAAAQRNADLTAKLLGVSRPQAGATQLTAPNDFIENLKEIIETSLTSSIRVEFDLANNLWPVDVNPGELEDMLLNLALNARDAMPGGGVLAIRTVNKVLDDVYAKHHPGSLAGEYVMISVSDTGTGMSAEVREQIFDPFFSTKEPGKGTGLGLSMIYSFVQRSDGFIMVHSEPGQGASFDVFLPRALEGVSRQVTVAAIAHNEPSRGTETVLVVDDEEFLVDLAVTHLEGLGYHTLSASSGEEAFDILKVNPDIDLLFSDITMPGKLNGYDLALAAMQLRPSLKVLLTSGFAKERDSAKGDDDVSLSRLTTSCLNKPYTLTELGAAV